MPKARAKIFCLFFANQMPGRKNFFKYWPNLTFFSHFYTCHAACYAFLILLRKRKKKCRKRKLHFRKVQSSIQKCAFALKSAEMGTLHKWGVYNGAAERHEWSSNKNFAFKILFISFQSYSFHLSQRCD